MRRTILALSSSTGEAESEVRMVFNNFERLGLQYRFRWLWSENYFTGFDYPRASHRHELTWGERARPSQQPLETQVLRSWDILRNLDIPGLRPLENQVLKGSETQILTPLGDSSPGAFGDSNPERINSSDLMQPNLEHNELIILTVRFLSWNKLNDENDWSMICIY